MQYDNFAQFFTATNLNWLPLLAKDEHKQLLIAALQQRVRLKQVVVYAYVIMPNHFHCIWRIADGIGQSNFQRDFLKWTAKQILMELKVTDRHLYEKLKVNQSDRTLQVWERNSLSIDVYSEHIFLQKLDYIHNNPIQQKWNLVSYSEDYLYSSAAYYFREEDPFQIITHYQD